MSRSISFGVGLLLVFALWLVSRSARAEVQGAKATPVYVLAIWTDDADDQADALTKALRGRARQAPGWSLLETNQSFETLAIALKCPPKPDPACLQRIGDQLKADHYVWGTMEKKGGATGEVSADLHLWTRGRPPVEARADLADSLNDASEGALRAIATDLFGQLTGAGSASGPPSPPGVGEPTVPSMRERSGAPSPVSERSFPLRTVLAYSAIVVGAGFLVASAVEAGNWIHDSNASADDRKLVPRSVTNVCSADPLGTGAVAALDACNKGKDALDASTVGWIFAGVGAALAGTGIWLIASDRGSRQAQGEESRALGRPKLMLLPSFEARAGKLDICLTF